MARPARAAPPRGHFKESKINRKSAAASVTAPKKATGGANMYPNYQAFVSLLKYIQSHPHFATDEDDENIEAAVSLYEGLMEADGASKEDQKIWYEYTKAVTASLRKRTGQLKTRQAIGYVFRSRGFVALCPFELATRVARRMFLCR